MSHGFHSYVKSLLSLFEDIHTRANQRHQHLKSKALGFNFHVHATDFAHLPGQLRGHVANHVATWAPWPNGQSIPGFSFADNYSRKVY